MSKVERNPAGVIRKKHMNKKTIGFSSLLLSGLTFGSFGLWIRLLNKEMTVYQQIVFRNGFALLFSFLIIVIAKRVFPKLNGINKKNLLGYTLTVPIAVILYNLSILKTTIALTTFSFYAGTILTSMIFGIVIFKEKMTQIKLLSFVFVLIGIFLFAYPISLTSMHVGLILGLLSGAFDGISNVFRKDLSGKVDKYFLVFLTTLGGVIVSGIMIFYSHHELNFIQNISLASWIIGPIFGFILIAVNYLLLVGFQNFDLSIGTIILSSELLFALIFGLLFFHELPAVKEIIGGLFIALAVITPNTKLLKPSNS